MISSIGGILLVIGVVIPSTRQWRSVAINTLVALATTGLIFTSLELFLLLYESTDHQAPDQTDRFEKISEDTPEPGEAWREPDIDPEVRKIVAARGKPLTLPENWKQRRVEIQGHQARFTNDVAAMNAFVRSRGLPPIVGMVLHQQPQYQDRGYQLTRIAEEVMLRAGFTVVPTEDYFRRYNNRNLAVSQWEGHPSEEANQIFASMLEVQLRQRPELGPYRTEQAHPEGDAVSGSE